MDIPSVYVVPPSAVGASDRECFEKLVREGGQVDPATFPALFKNAHALAFARVAGVLTGVAALKRPNDSYRDTVFGKAHATRAATEFPLELGWVSVAPVGQRRGLVRCMLDPLLAQREGMPVYATSALDNVPMHAALRRFGFEPHGQPYEATRNAQFVQLFVLG